MLATAATVLALVGAATACPVKRDVPFGQTLYGCTVPGDIAITFDDGPYIYTDHALDLLNAAGFKATFFLNGQNFDNIHNHAATVQRMKNEGHQIGSHTWSHADLGTLDAAGVTAQLTQLEDALKLITGSYATYLRPPYLSMSAQSLSTAGSLGYHIIDISIDTKDYELQNNIAQAHAKFIAGLDAGGTIALCHDVHQNTVEQLIPLMIQTLKSRGLRGVTVGECLGDTASGWYASSRGSTPGTPTNPSTPTPSNPSALPESEDGTCGAAAGKRCPASQCCSQYNWCGVSTSTEHCGAGCQIAYGICS